MIKDNVQFNKDKSYKNCFVKTYENEYIYLSTTNLKTFNDGADLELSGRVFQFMAPRCPSALFVISNFVLLTYSTCLSRYLVL